MRDLKFPAAAFALAALFTIPAASAMPVVQPAIGMKSTSAGADVQQVQYYDPYRRPYYAQQYPPSRNYYGYGYNYDAYWRYRAEADRRERPITRQLNLNEARRAEQFTRQYPYGQQYYGYADPYYER
jgi:hypothetical protein